MQKQTCFNSFRIKYHLKTFWPTYDPFTFSIFFLYLHFVIWILRLIDSIIELLDFMMQQFLPGVTLNMLSEINHIRHFIKIQFVNKGIEFIKGIIQTFFHMHLL